MNSLSAVILNLYLFFPSSAKLHGGMTEGQHVLCEVCIIVVKITERTALNRSLFSDCASTLFCEHTAMINDAAAGSWQQSRWGA
jgi:hypothetical protein